jgi:hypothetical protein
MRIDSLFMGLPKRRSSTSPNPMIEELLDIFSQEDAWDFVVGKFYSKTFWVV